MHEEPERLPICASFNGSCADGGILLQVARARKCDPLSGHDRIPYCEPQGRGRNPISAKIPVDHLGGWRGSWIPPLSLGAPGLDFDLGYFGPHSQVFLNSQPRGSSPPRPAAVQWDSISTVPASPVASCRKLDHGHSSGLAHRPRATGLRCRYRSFSTRFSSL